MRLLFSPAIALMNRLGYTKKFTLLGLVSVVAFAVVVYSLYASLDEDIRASQQELEGIALATPISRTVQLFQQHRGLSAAVLGGNKNMRGRLAAKEKESAESFNVLERKLPPNLASSEDWRSIKTNWKRLLEKGLRWTVEENFVAHTRLIDQLLIFKVVVSGEYVLLLDPQADTYYLIDVAVNRLPMALEHLGQLRAYGIDVLARKRITEPQKVAMKTLVDEFNDEIKFLKVDFDQVTRHNPALQNALSTASGSIAGSAQHIADLVESDIFTGRFATSPEDFYMKTSAAIDNGYTQMHESLLPMIGNLIKARIARLENALRTSVGIALLLLLVVTYCAIGIYYAIIGSIQSLDRSARAFAGGDMRERINLGTRDELSQAGDSFNKMADGFSALLAVHKEDEARLRATIETALDAVVQMDAEGITIGWNNQAEKIFGWAKEEMIGRALHETIIPPQYREAHMQGLKRFLASGEGQVLKSRIEMTGLHRDGHEFPVELSITPVKTAGKYEFNGFIRDISERKQAEAALLEKESQYRIAIETSVDGFWMNDTRGRLIRVNDAYMRLSGYSRDELLNMSVPDLEAQERREETAAHMEKVMQDGYDKFESKHKKKDGSIWPVQISVTYTPAAGGRFFTFISDLTGRKQAEEKMLYLAHYDALTGLPNRILFHDRLDQEIRKAHRASLKVALLFIDLDRFKEVNDTLGHSMGDILLVEAARRIGDCVRDTDTVARLGGDEFIIILSELDDASSIQRVAENILHRLSEPFHLGYEIAHVSASIGITLYPDDATGIEDLLKDADQAMYVAKNAGRNRLSYFTPALQQAAQTRLRLLNDLRGALAGDQFMVYYQPIMEQATGRIHKAEALIRWQHPVRGMVSPAEFIPLAEESGLIIEIGEWVFKEAARQVKRWKELHDTGFQISVNVSPVQFHNADSLYQTWRAYLQELGLSGQSFAIEITEGLLLDAESSVMDKLLEFRDAGMQVSIDDFGTGYSSLSYLKRFDIDYLKIDQSFVRDLATDPDDMALSEAIIVMAHKLGLKVIAEGVETEAQRKLLAAAGCDYAQGYLFSRPVPAKEFEALLKDNSGG